MKSLIFQGWGVRAILNGSKTMTRRIIKPQPPCGLSKEVESGLWTYSFSDRDWKPKFQIGETIYVRETYWIDPVFKDEPLKGIYYRADPDFYKKDIIKWKSSMFMPEKYARIFLKITDIKVERVQDISMGDCYKDGIPQTYGEAIKIFGNKALEGRESHIWDNYTSIENFKWVWIKINGKDSWEQNPFCWAYSFERTPHGNE